MQIVTIVLVHASENGSRAGIMVSYCYTSKTFKCVISVYSPKVKKMVSSFISLFGEMKKTRTRMVGRKIIKNLRIA